MRSLLHTLRRHWLVLGLVALVYGLDQVTKLAVSQALDLGRSWPAEGFFRITHSYNTGSAFGLFSGQNTLLILVSFVGIGLLTWIYRTQPNPNRWLRFSLGLQLAGALGNLTDRIAIGHVVDFIDVGPWPIFNVADSSLVTGVALLVWLLLTGRAVQRPDGPADAAAEDAAGPVSAATPPPGADDGRPVP